MEEILVDENGYKQFFEELKKIDELSYSNSSLASEEYEAAVGDGWHDNFAFEESMRESRALAKRKGDLLSKKQYLKVIDDYDKPKDLVNIGDKISVNIKYSDDDIENEVIVLTGKYIPNTNCDIKEVSLNSPLGKAIFKSKVGANTSYFVEDKEILITIIEKINN